MRMLSRQDFKLATFIHTKQFSQCVLACGHGLVEVAVKFVPHRAVECARTFQPFDAAQL
jgi:hypothetical protein